MLTPHSYKERINDVLRREVNIMKHHMLRGEYSYALLTKIRDTAIGKQFNVMANLINKTLQGDNHVKLRLHSY